MGATTAIATSTQTDVLHLRAKDAPAAVPDVKTLKAAIPAHCFERSLVRSLSYVARDVFFVSLLFYSAVCITRLDQPWFVTVPLWALYSLAQGLFFTGLWILAHECGHDSFSPYLNVNAFVGWAIHCSLLVPFFSWKFSHARHHRYHNHMEKDTVFVPWTKEQYDSRTRGATLLSKLVDHAAADTPIVTLAALFVHQVFGWPAYVFLNVGSGYNSLVKGNRGNSGRYRQSHLDPSADIFTASEGPFVALSNLGIAITLGTLYMVSRSLGVGNTLLLYGLPYLWMNHWIGTFIFLTENEAAFRKFANPF